MDSLSWLVKRPVEKERKGKGKGKKMEGNF